MIFRPQHRDTWRLKHFNLYISNSACMDVGQEWWWGEDECYLDMRALELSQQTAVIGKHDHVKLVSVWVSDQDVSSICHSSSSSVAVTQQPRHLPEISIPLGKLVMFSQPILRTNCPSSVNTTTLWPWKGFYEWLWRWRQHIPTSGWRIDWTWTQHWRWKLELTLKSQT